MKSKLIHAEGGYTLWEEPQATASMVELLENTTWGTGSVQYKHFWSAQRIRQIPDPRFFTLRVEQELLVTIVFCRRTLSHGDLDSQGYYIRFFAASPKIKGRGLVSLASRKVMEWIRDNETKPTLYYAAVEENNIRSKKIVDNVGFQSMAAIKTFGISRFSPKAKLPIRQLTDGDFEHFYPKLRAQYHGHNCWIPDNLNITPGYWVMDHEDEIVLGVQVHLARWSINQLPGLIGKAMPLAKYIPVMNRIMNADDFRFMTIEGLYVHPDFREHLLDFLETLLHQFKHYTLISWWDSRDENYQFLSQQPGLGVIRYFTPEAEAGFLVSPHNIDPTEKAALQNRPFYVSNLDYI